MIKYADSTIRTWTAGGSFRQAERSEPSFIPVLDHVTVAFFNTPFADAGAGMAFPGHRRQFVFS